MVTCSGHYRDTVATSTANLSCGGSPGNTWSAAIDGSLRISSASPSRLKSMPVTETRRTILVSGRYVLDCPGCPRIIQTYHARLPNGESRQREWRPGDQQVRPAVLAHATPRPVARWPWLGCPVGCHVPPPAPGVVARVSSRPTGFVLGVCRRDRNARPDDAVLHHSRCSLLQSPALTRSVEAALLRRWRAMIRLQTERPLSGLAT